MRDKPGIADERLLTCLRECYRIEAKTLEFLPLGKDTYAGIYRAESVEGVAYALKVKFGAFYEASCQAPRYLREQGIASVVAPLATMDGVPWARLDDGEGWTLAVYPFIAGERGWEPPLTEAQWSELGAIFRAIHQVAPPPQGGIPSMRRERFDPTEYRRAMLRYDAWLAASESGDVAEQGLHMRWEQYRERVEATQATMERLAEMLQVNAATYVICHADLHPGNLLRNAEDMFVIDWDDVMLAPRSMTSSSWAIRRWMAPRWRTHRRSFAATARRRPIGRR